MDNSIRANKREFIVFGKGINPEEVRDNGGYVSNSAGVIDCQSFVAYFDGDNPVGLEYDGNWAIADEDTYDSVYALAELAFQRFTLEQREVIVLKILTLYRDEMEDLDEDKLIAHYGPAGEIYLSDEVEDYRDALYCFRDVADIDEILTAEHPPKEPLGGWNFNDEEEVALLYRIESGDPAIKQRILDYNQDDCLATGVVVDAIRGL